MTESVLLALLPIVLLTGLGLMLDRSRFVDGGFWPQAERLGYYVLLPSLFFHGLATARVDDLPIGDLALTLLISTLVVAVLVVALRPLLKVDGPAFTSIFQGSIRFNNYVGVTLAVGLFGAKGVALAAICNATIVPVVNVLCVMVFARHGPTRLGALATLKQVATNPLIVASAAGIAFRGLGWPLPPGIEPALKALGSASLPLGLLCVGAALDFRTAGRWAGPVVFSSLMKFLALPVATLVVARQLGLEGPALMTALLFQALPTASSAYILARQLGGDTSLMAGITAIQTVMAMAAIPLVILGANGWLTP